MEKIYTVEGPKGTFSCELGITVKEWEDILKNKKLTTDNYMTALMAFYSEPGHKATCQALGIKHYGNAVDAQKFNSWITQFGKAVVKHLNRFHVFDPDEDDKERFWPVAMGKGTELDSGHFEWTLRQELVKAIENLGWNNHRTWIPFFEEMADKLLPYKSKRKELLDLVYGLDSKFVGYIRDDDGGHMSDLDPFSVFAIINRGITKENRVYICQYFKERLGINAKLPDDFDGVPVVNAMKAVFFYRENVGKDVEPLWDLFDAALKKDESQFALLFDKVIKQQGIKWNVTMGLYWIRPYDYIALDSRNREYLPKLGVPVFKESQFDSTHYLNVLHAVKDKIAKREIMEKDIPAISYHAWVRSGDEDRKYWLVGYSFGGNESQIDRFKEDGIWEGGFDESVTGDQKMMALAKTIKEGDVIILKSSATKGKNHDLPFLRVKGIGMVTGNVTTYKVEQYTRCKCSVKYYSFDQVDFDGNIYGAYRKTIHVADSKAQDVIDYANSILNGETMIQKKYQAYIDLLNENYNLVLTGAPGTGKTFMAQAIADEMGAESMFVQFHPSFDYTDFVEGLRPIEKPDGQMGFERKDGVFKEFCRKAIKNMVDSEKSVGDLTKEISWEEKLQQLIDDSIENGTKYKLATGGNFTIVENREHSVVVHNEQNEKTTQVLVNTDEILELLVQEVPLNNVKDIRAHFNRRFGTQADSYAYIITKSVRAMKQKTATADAAKVLRKPFVFIIDEINRGEASKIFGELFYAIDPGYRVKKDRIGKKEHLVQTQYQNLVPDADVFANGFYVPENVYILATMNDIDRSVESMDFAMRRRFTWKEVTPEDTQDMLDPLPCADEAKAAMKRLNEVIAATDGLGAAYSIGPSYFLKLGENGGDFKKLWEMNIEPLLKEYLRGFRKSKEILEKFSKAYFEIKEATEELIDEN